MSENEVEEVRPLDCGCGEHPKLKPHLCPYYWEINDDDTECECCEECMENCAMEI